jgi:pteridine reductase
MTQESSGKIVLITGAARRIGAAIVRELHGAGYRLVLHYHRSASDAEALAGELDALRPDSVRLLRADLSEAGKPAELVDHAAGFWGGLDVLVNNASAFYPTPLATVTEAEWDDLMASNLKAPFFLAQAAGEVLRRRGGCIVNMGDIYAERPLRGHAVYSIAKAGLAALTRALAVELAPEVRVNGVAPGAILWPEYGPDVEDKAEILARIPLGRAGAPADIARTVRFLIEAAPYMTGQILTVDGGRSVLI